MLIKIHQSFIHNAVLLILLTCFVLPYKAIASPNFPPGTQSITIPNVNGVRSDLLKNITSVVEHSITEGNYPGAVIVAGHHGHIIYRGVFGNRRILPNIAPMRFDTIFDLASLTKVVATTPAIMQLVEQGKLNIDAPVKQYWPEFANNGKENITIRELLTHTAGLPADITMVTHGETAAIHQIENLKPQHTPGTDFLYSDVDFIILAYLVEIITHERFDQYVQNHLFKPLGMNHTFFLPSNQLQDRIAPTEIINGKLHWGEVHDPTAYAMGGISGNAGLFSDATDLAIYSQWLLDGGRLPRNIHHNEKKSQYILGPLTILKMITPQTTHDSKEVRGLGWDIDSYLSNRGILFPINSFGHTGWTGTSIWIDPSTRTWVIILTSRTHPALLNNNKISRDRKTIANIVAASITDISPFSLQNTYESELNRAYKNIPLAKDY